jgi:hypothetical protein
MNINYSVSLQLPKHSQMTGNSQPPQFSGGLRRTLSDPTLNNIFQHQGLEPDKIANDVNSDRLKRHGAAIKTDVSLAQGNVSAKRVSIVKNSMPFQPVETAPTPQNRVLERARKYSGLLRTWIDKRSMQDATPAQITQEARPIAKTNGLVPPTEPEIRVVIENAANQLEAQAAIRKQQVQAQLAGQTYASTSFNSPFAYISNAPPTSTAPSVPMSRSSSSSGFTTSSESEAQPTTTVAGERNRNRWGEDFQVIKTKRARHKQTYHMTGSNGYNKVRNRYRTFRKNNPNAPKTDFRFRVGNAPTSRTGSPNQADFKRTSANP